MKSKSNFAKKILVGVALLMAAGLLTLATAPADQPLSKDDITLLLLASSPASKMVQMVEQRGIDFQMDADLAKKFHDQGASDDLIDALRKAGNKPAKVSTLTPAPAANAVTPAEPEPSPGGKPNAPDAPEPRAATPPPAAPAPPSAPSSSEPVLHTRQSDASTPAPAASAPTLQPDSPRASSSSEPVLHTRQADASTSAPAAAGPTLQPDSPRAASSSEPTLHQPAKPETPSVTPATASGAGLKDPSPQEVQHIIQEFAAKEKIFRAARANYTYHQINKVEELGPNNEITGTYEQEWDILYDDKGNRIEKVTYAPLNSLKQLIITKEDIEGFRSIQPFVLTTDELPEYEITYLGHVKLDELTAFVFRIQPKEIEKGKQYFKGQVYVDDRDLQIVKSEGRQVPQDKKVHGQENLFPEFSTWREQIDGKFWFPTYTMGDDTLYFANGSVHMKEIVRYTDYKQFKSSGRILSVEAIDKSKDQTTPPANPPKN
jgi:hypothetical protein